MKMARTFSLLVGLVLKTAHGYREAYNREALSSPSRNVLILLPKSGSVPVH